MIKKSAIEKLMENIEIIPEAGCWIYQGALNNGGYGQISVNSKNQLAHRFSYSHFNGGIPDGLFVLHRCDVRACCNPHHLFAGTHQENMDDMISKGRNKLPPALTEERRVLKAIARQEEIKQKIKENEIYHRYVIADISLADEIVDRASPDDLKKLSVILNAIVERN